MMMTATVMQINCLGILFVVIVLIMRRCDRNFCITTVNDFKDRVADKECVVISHCRNEEFAAALKKAVAVKYPDKIVKIMPTRGLCSYYAERGGIIVGF